MSDPFELVRAEEMLRGYSARWFDEKLKVLAVEAEYDADLTNPESGAASRTFRLGGKIDAIVEDATGRVLNVEHKTSGEDVSAGSFYWRRLKINSQISGYLVGARALGFDPVETLYDVLGKPGQRPATTPLLDEWGMKIVLDGAGARVKTKDGKKHRETGDSALGYVLQTRPETVEEYRVRVREAICKEPDAYFVRGTVVRLQDEEKEASFDTWQTAASIREGRRLGRHPRNPDSCVRYGAPCSMFDVCTGEASVDDPTRYRRVVNMHEELSASKVGLPLLTNSEQGTYRACPRLHHYRYDLGIRAVVDSDNARFGSLCHVGLEQWWLGKKDGADEATCFGRAVAAMALPPPRHDVAPTTRKEVTL